MGLVYQELKALAQRQLQRESRAHTLQPTALVHEAWLRLVDQDVANLEDRRQFRRLCAKVMRQILVDHARRVNAKKRGEGRPVRLETAMSPAASESDAGDRLDLIALDEALEQFQERDPRRARVVELRVFCGMSVKEVADDLGVSQRTVEADWFFARAWLQSELAG